MLHTPLIYILSISSIFRYGFNACGIFQKRHNDHSHSRKNFAPFFYPCTALPLPLPQLLRPPILLGSCLHKLAKSFPSLLPPFVNVKRLPYWPL